MERERNKDWKNWSGEVSFRPRIVHRPRNEEELAQILKVALPPVRVIGSGHSFSPLVATWGTLISMEHFQGIFQVDLGKGEVTVGAGTLLSQLGPLLETHGLSLINQGDIDKQTLAGAISTGTHGTGMDLGCLSTQVVGLSLVTARGEILECSPATHPRLFPYLQLSLGTLGILTKIRLKLNPLYRLKERKENLDLNETLDYFIEKCKGHRHFEFNWFPYTERVAAKSLDLTEELKPTPRWISFLDNYVLENGVFGALSEMCRLSPGLSEPISKLCGRFIPQGERSDVAWKIFPNPRLVRFHEMEYAVPVELGPACLREIKRSIEKEKIQVHFPLEYRYVAQDSLPLSPFYKRDCAVISLHMYQGMPYEQFFKGAEKICLSFNGRPHWGKQHYLGAQDFHKLYPAWPTFLALRKELDPQGLFLNDHLEAIMGGEEEVNKKWGSYMDVGLFADS